MHVASGLQGQPLAGVSLGVSSLSPRPEVLSWRAGWPRAVAVPRVTGGTSWAGPCSPATSSAHGVESLGLCGDVGPCLGRGSTPEQLPSKAVAPQAISNVPLLPIPFPSRLLSVVVTVRKKPNPETEPNWKASDKFASLKNKGKRAFCKVIAVRLRPSGFPGSPAANSPAPGHTARLATSLVARPSRAALDFFGAWSPSSLQSPLWLYFSHSSLGTRCHRPLMMKKPFPLVF